MGKINICFPIVWNGLIEGRSDLGQYQSFKTVFDKSYADDDQDRRSDVSSFVNARQRRRLSPEIQMDFLKMEKMVMLIP